MAIETGMAHCIKELDRAFLQASSMRYSGLALSEVSPSSLSHDSISRCFFPHELWKLVKPFIDKRQPCLLIANDTVLAKPRSQEIASVHYQYSGNEHAVIALLAHPR